MNLNDLQNLDPQKIGSWPAAIRLLIILAVMAALLGAGYWFHTQEQIADLEKSEKTELELRTTFETKQRQAASLGPLKEQLEEMKQSFGALLRLLPNRTQIEGLLIDISQAGLSAGLEFELFKPSGEVKEEFIATLPIEMAVTGNYHEFGEFISAVAALPRIVTQHEIQISPFREIKVRRGTETEGKVKRLDLRMTMIAKTYRYLEEDEIEEEEQ